MFGMGGSEILVILIVALLFLGPDKLPEAATKISKGIRELRKQTREVQQTIENDTEIGGAIRDLKSALRGDEIRQIRTQVKETLTAPLDEVKTTVTAAAAPDPAPAPAPAPEPEPEPEKAKAPLLPPSAGEQAESDSASPDDDSDLAAMIKPAAGTVAHDG